MTWRVLGNPTLVLYARVLRVGEAPNPPECGETLSCFVQRQNVFEVLTSVCFCADNALTAFTACSPRSGITATVFGSTGMLGRYVVNHLGGAAVQVDDIRLTPRVETACVLTP